MASKGYKQTKEHIAKRMKGSKKTWFKKGQKLSKQEKKKISNTLKKRIKKYGKWGCMRIKLNDKSRKKLSNSLKKVIHTKEWNQKISETKKGISNYKIKGNKNPNWQGGKSFEPYSVDWTEDLKRAIRKRDRYTCQVCKKEPATSVHHIDYNKKNSNLNNLITLCRKCHSKTNFNRKKWSKYFNQ